MEDLFRGAPIDGCEQLMHGLGTQKAASAGAWMFRVEGECPVQVGVLAAGLCPQCFTAAGSFQLQADASASRKVDLPEPFSPTITVTPVVSRRGSAAIRAIAGMSKYQASGCFSRLIAISRRITS